MGEEPDCVPSCVGEDGVNVLTRTAQVGRVLGSPKHEGLAFGEFCWVLAEFLRVWADTVFLGRLRSGRLA